MSAPKTATHSRFVEPPGARAGLSLTAVEEGVEVNALPGDVNLALVSVMIGTDAPPLGGGVAAHVVVNAHQVPGSEILVEALATAPATRTWPVGRIPIYTEDLCEIVVSTAELEDTVWASGRVAVETFAAVVDPDSDLVVGVAGRIVSASIWSDVAPEGGPLTVAVQVNGVERMTLALLADTAEVTTARSAPAVAVAPGDKIRWSYRGSISNQPTIWGVLELETP